MKVYDELVLKFGKDIDDMVLDCSDSVPEVPRICYLGKDDNM